MKRVFALLLTLSCIFFLFVGCIKVSTYEPTEIENVSISITDVSSIGATVVIKDTNEVPYTYGEWYKIERNICGKWFEVRTVVFNYGFPEIGYLPNENGEVVLHTDWEWLYGELACGQYRILKEVNRQYISAEFVIGDGCNDGILDTEKPYFMGKVLEKYDDRCLLEITDTGNGHFTVGDKVIVNTNIKNCPQFDVGDYLRISFDGKMALSYPPQVLTVYSIIKMG